MKLFRHKLPAAALAIALMLLFTGAAMAAQRYETLEYGDRGPEVLKLQQCLLTLGYDPQGVDGKYGRGTENAVRMYQAANGLEADGKAGHLTLSKLFDGQSVPAGGGSSSGSSSSGGSGSSSGTIEPGTVTSTNPNTLKYGDSGSRVTELQSALTKLGYNTNGIDGKFGRGTHQAVVQFQKDNGLYPDGLVGTKTLQLIDQKLAALGSSGGSGSSSGSSGSSGSGSTSGSSSSGSGTGSTGNSGSSGTTSSGVPANLTRTLRKGYTGDDVLTVQKKLKELGYYTSMLDGVYGNGSIAAVRAFQQNNGLTADGLAGYRTFKVMFSGSAVPAGSASGSTGSTGASGSTGSGGNAGNAAAHNGDLIMPFGDDIALKFHRSSPFVWMFVPFSSTRFH
jgi:peptidoglycan hydrolase-like protein with peptidoglycan-binding domain